jgi:hypothetical protein
MNRLTVSVAVVALLCASAVSACEFGKKSTVIYQSIGLSEEQIAKLEPLRDEMKKVRAETATESEEFRKQIDAELLKKAPNKKAISSMVQKQGDLRKRVSQARADALLKAKAIVSEEQFAKLVENHWGCRCVDSESVLGLPAGEE